MSPSVFCICFMCANVFLQVLHMLKHMSQNLCLCECVVCCVYAHNAKQKRRKKSQQKIFSGYQYINIPERLQHQQATCIPKCPRERYITPQHCRGSCREERKNLSNRLIWNRKREGKEVKCRGSDSLTVCSCFVLQAYCAGELKRDAERDKMEKNGDLQIRSRLLKLTERNKARERIREKEEKMQALRPFHIS